MTISPSSLKQTILKQHAETTYTHLYDIVHVITDKLTNETYHEVFPALDVLYHQFDGNFIDFIKEEALNNDEVYAHIWLKHYNLMEKLFGSLEPGTEDYDDYLIIPEEYNTFIYKFTAVELPNILFYELDLWLKGEPNTYVAKYTRWITNRNILRTLYRERRDRFLDIIDKIKAEFDVDRYDRDFQDAIGEALS